MQQSLFRSLQPRAGGEKFPMHGAEKHIEKLRSVSVFTAVNCLQLLKDLKLMSTDYHCIAGQICLRTTDFPFDFCLVRC